VFSGSIDDVNVKGVEASNPDQQAGMEALFISVIVPTLNRCEILKNAIASAQKQTWPADRYEIVVVDNGSTDGTSQHVQQVAEKSDKPVRLIREPRLGLHNARHAGARAARGEILIFTDDDATFDPDWVRAYGEAFRQYPEMMAAGGPERPIWETPPPQWLLDYRGETKKFGILSLMEPHNELRLDQKGFFFGVNMAIRREVLFKVGGFNPESFGDLWFGDGETGLNRKLWEKGMLIGYVPEALVYHHIPPQRMTVGYFRRRMANEAASEMYALFHQGVPHWLRLLKQGAGIAARNGRCWVGALLLRGRTDPPSLKIQIRAAQAFARLKYVIRLAYDKDFRKLVLKENWLEDSSTLSGDESAHGNIIDRMR
jgi:glucosyl-dolichyl phosphate glucuronosyltransferase